MKNKKSTIITFGDPHITENSIDELSITFDEIIKKYGDKDYIMIMLGDFYDKKRPTPLEILFGTKYASIFKEKFKEVIFLSGNHDKTETIGSTDYLKYLGIKIVDDYSYDKMFFGHGMTNHSMMEYGTAIYQVKDLEEKYKLSVLGHLHMFQKLSSKVFHPGSVRYCGFNEVGYSTKYVGIINNRKIEFKGTSIMRKIDYYDVATIAVSVEKGGYGVNTYECTCKNCSVITTPLGMKPVCCFVLALAIYINDKITIQRYAK